MGRVMGDVPEDIVRAAKADPVLSGRVILSSERRVPLLHGGECVGFVTPHETRSVWRAGPLFVVPQHRGHGHVVAFYNAHRDREWIAFIPDTAPASLAMHKRAGFEPWKAAKRGLWMRREAIK